MKPRWVIAGGGTGGHLYAGIAVAEALRARRPDADILFVGTERGLEARVVPEQGYDLKTIKVEGVKNRGLLSMLKAMIQVPLSILASGRILKEFGATAVLGVGGYASGPLAMAAWLMRIPVAVQEQNALPGITNRILGRLVRVVYTSWPATQGFPGNRMHHVGNPIRSSIRPVDAVEGTFRLLVFGGSQGARTLNRAMAEAAPLLTPLADRVTIIHQQGKDNTVDVAEAYRQAGLSADVRPYFDDMPEQYAHASLAFCRAGATSLAELAAARLPAILVPFPFAADNHQEKNADVFVTAGAAEKLLDADTTGEAIARRIRTLVDNPEQLSAMRRGMASLARPEAAEALVEHWLQATETAHV